MALAHRDGRREVFPTRPRQVYDITGAGDMVLAVLGMALAAGADYDPAIRLANIAGGLEVEKIGVATVTREEILRDLLHGGERGDEPDWKRCGRASRWCASWTRRRRWASASRSPTAASTCCTPATCSICRRPAPRPTCWWSASTATPACAALKGPGRPVNPVEARALVLAGLQAVDYVTVFDEPTPLELIQARAARRAGQGRRLPPRGGGRGGVRRVVRRPGPPGAAARGLFDDAAAAATRGGVSSVATSAQNRSHGHTDVHEHRRLPAQLDRRRGHGDAGRPRPARALPRRPPHRRGASPTSPASSSGCDWFDDVVFLPRRARGRRTARRPSLASSARSASTWPCCFPTRSAPP